MSSTSRRRLENGLYSSGLRLFVGALLLVTGACAHPLTSPKDKPPAAEFGVGPKVSRHGLYSATLQPAQPLRTRRLQKATLTLRDAAGQPVEGATLAIDGGMPEHGHGLPTQPRVTGASAGGSYDIDGLRFNMGGWWELSFAIQGPAGADQVTFHLQL